MHDNYLTKFEKADVVIYDGQSTEKTAFSWKLTVGMPRYALIGGTRGYNQFRRVHEQIADYEYVELDVNDSAELERALKDTRYSGYNIANPYKVEVIQYLDEISDDSKRAGAVDVVMRMPDGRLRGFNTEMAAFRYMVEGYVEDRKCLIFGSGGAATASARTLKDLGASDIVIVSRDPEEAAAKLIPDPDGEKVRLGDIYKVTGYDRLHLHYDAHVVINCTPSGKSPDVEHSPLTDHRLTMRMFSGLELAVDLIYDPYRTKFLQDARRLTGCHIKSGVEMLIFRAIASRNIWLGKPDETDQDKRFITPIKRRLLQEQLNVIAVGMPGSGKTTIMRRYAYELGLKFIDTDEETEKLMGEKIADVLTEPGLGEDYFKAMEHLAVKEACKSRGAVIATGGSTALNPLNRDLLRANGIVVYVRRPLDKLDKRGRQISINKGLAEFFNARDRIYRRTADMSILNSRIFGERRAKTGEGNTYNYELKGFVYYIARKIERYLNEIADNKWT